VGIVVLRSIVVVPTATVNTAVSVSVRQWEQCGFMNQSSYSMGQYRQCGITTHNGGSMCQNKLFGITNLTGHSQDKCEKCGTKDYSCGSLGQYD